MFNMKQQNQRLPSTSICMILSILAIVLDMIKYSGKIQNMLIKGLPKLKSDVVVLILYEFHTFIQHTGCCSIVGSESDVAKYSLDTVYHNWNTMLKTFNFQLNLGQIKLNVSSSDLISAFFNWLFVFLILKFLEILNKLTLFVFCANGALNSLSSLKYISQ